MSTGEISATIIMVITFALFGRYLFRLYFQGDYPKADKRKRRSSTIPKIRFDYSQDNAIKLLRGGKETLYASMQNGQAYIYEPGKHERLHKMSYDTADYRNGERMDKVEIWMMGYKKEKLSKPETGPIRKDREWVGLRKGTKDFEVVID